MYKQTFTAAALLAVLMVSITACTTNQAELGTKENPIKFAFVPSVDGGLIDEKSRIVEKYLEENTPYEFEITVPNSYIAVVESFGTHRADIASLTTFGYILAHERYEAEAGLLYVRHGSPKYKAQIIVRADSDINSVEDLDGKRFAYVDPASTSGYLLPAKYLADHGVTLAETTFAQKHDNVVTMLYQGSVDGGATFYSPPYEGVIQDARRLVKTQFPDVEEKIKILALTDEIPNDPIVFRKDVPEEIKTAVKDALLAFISTEEGKNTFSSLYGADALRPASDADYDGVRDLLNTLNKDASELIK